MKLTNLDAVKVSASTGLDAIRRAPIVDYITDIRCIRIQDVSQSKPFSQWGFTEVSKKDFSSRQLLKNDILIARTGATVGVNLIIRDTLNAVYNNGLIKLRVNEKENNPLFIYYVLQSEKYKQYIYSIAFGTVAQPNMKINDFLSFQFPKIDFKKQGFIAKILGDLDCKIEKNNQINETLEAMAQAIFKSWFVDFDPVKAKVEAKAKGLDDDAINRAAMRVIASKTDIELDEMQAESPAEYANLQTTASHFPDELVESELGMIPKGWEVSSFGEVSNCLDSKRIPLSKREREGKQPGNIPYYGATSIMDYVNESIFDGIYLLIGEDGSVIKENGTPFIQYIWGESWVNNHAHVLEGVNSISTEHLLLFISRTNISAYITGAVQLKLNQRNMKSIPFILASKELNVFFGSWIQPFFKNYRENIEENKSLIELRDSLLPKLLSGEIEV